MKPHYKIHYDTERDGCTTCAFTEAVFEEPADDTCPRATDGRLICLNRNAKDSSLQTWFELKGE